MPSADIGLIVIAKDTDLSMISNTRLWMHPMYSVFVVTVVSVRRGRRLAAHSSPSLILTPETDVATNVRRGLRSLFDACTPTIVLQIHTCTFANRLSSMRKYMASMWRQSRHADINSLVYATLRSCDTCPPPDAPLVHAAGPARMSIIMRALRAEGTPPPSMMALFGPTRDPHFMQERLYVLVDPTTSTTRYIQRRRCSEAGSTRRYYIDGDDSRAYNLKRIIHPPIVPSDATNRPRIDAEWYRVAYEGASVCEYYSSGLTKAHICHPDQIRKYFPDAACVIDGKQAMVLWDGARRPLREFVTSQMSLGGLVARCFDGPSIAVTPPQSPSNACDVLVVLTSHNPSVCMLLLREMHALFTSGTVDVCLVFHNPVSDPRAHDHVIRHLTNAARQAGFCLHLLPFAHDCGSDIPVFATSVRWLRDSGITDAYAWILKLHTKTHRIWRQSITQGFMPFLSKRQQRTLPDGCGGAACGLWYGDMYCRRYIESTFGLTIDRERHTFAAGSVFLMRRSILLDILDDPRVCDMVHCAMVAGWYYDNTSCVENSPMHSVERLFGYLPAERGTPLRDISPRTRVRF